MNDELSIYTIIHRLLYWGGGGALLCLAIIGGGKSTPCPPPLFLHHCYSVFVTEQINLIPPVVACGR